MPKRPAAAAVGPPKWYEAQFEQFRKEATKHYKLEDYGPKDRDEILLFGSPAPRRDPDDGLFDEVFSGFMFRSRPDPKERLVWELLGHFKGAERFVAIKEEPYRDLRVAELLLFESAKSMPDQLHQALAMAQLAEAIALTPEPQETRLAECIRAKACCRQANVWRLRREWRESERSLREAWRALSGWSETAPERKPLLRTLSALREDQGRFDEAVELLRRAVLLEETFFSSANEPLLVRQSMIHLKQNDLGRAMTLLTAVAERIAGNPMIGMLVRHEVALGRAACLAALDLRRPAQRLLEKERAARAITPRKKERLRFEWFDCRVALRLGDLAYAIPRLEALERWFHAYYPCEACLCWLDLSQAYRLAGRPPRDFRRLDGLLATQQKNLDFLLRPEADKDPGDEWDDDPDDLTSLSAGGIPMQWLVEGLAEIRSISDRTAGEWAALAERFGRLVPSPLALS